MATSPLRSRLLSSCRRQAPSIRSAAVFPPGGGFWGAQARAELSRWVLRRDFHACETIATSALSCGARSKTRIQTSRREGVLPPTPSGSHSPSSFLLFSSPELELSTKRKPKQLLKALQTYVSLRPRSSPSTAEEIDFTGVCDLHVELEGDARLV